MVRIVFSKLLFSQKGYRRKWWMLTKADLFRPLIFDCLFNKPAAQKNEFSEEKKRRKFRNINYYHLPSKRNDQIYRCLKLDTTNFAACQRPFPCLFFGKKHKTRYVMDKVFTEV